MRNILFDNFLLYLVEKKLDTILHSICFKNIRNCKFVKRLANKQGNSTNTSMDKDNMAYYYNASHCHRYMTLETFVHLDRYFHFAK